MLILLAFMLVFVYDGDKVNFTALSTIEASNVPKDESVLTIAYSVKKTFVPLWVKRISVE